MSVYTYIMFTFLFCMIEAILERHQCQGLSKAVSDHLKWWKECLMIKALAYHGRLLMIDNGNEQDQTCNISDTAVMVQVCVCENIFESDWSR